MRIVHVSCTALGLTLAAAVPAAHAQAVIDAPQTVIAPQPVAVAPSTTTIVTHPARTVRTVTTVRTVRPAVRRRVTVTRHTYVTDRVIPSTTTTTTTVAAAPAYGTVAVAPPYVGEPGPYARGPLYDVVTPAPAPAPAPAIIPAAAPVAAPVGGAVPFYRYVYEDDRILVIDPNTGIAVQAIPR